MANKKEQIAQEIAKAVGAGKAASLEVVDFNDPNRPKTCLEVDFPILPVNQVAVVEGNAGKPIYQMSKWWARRRSTVFRAILIAAATRAPEDRSHAAKLVWDHYYANHQKRGAFRHLKVADIFMGGGTTLVEGGRLGMNMLGNDLSPVAWFVVKQELTHVSTKELEALLADIAANVKPQLMPFFACDGPGGERGRWTHLSDGTVMGSDFDPLSIPRDQRGEYAYEGPEVVCTFWAKHGPCEATGCGHRTPIISSPVVSVKSIVVRAWSHSCTKCGTPLEIEEEHARMAPDVPLVIASTEPTFAVLDRKRGVECPKCLFTEPVKLGTPIRKKIDLTLLVHPEWMAGAARLDGAGEEYGGSTRDSVSATAQWIAKRGERVRLLEVRGALPDKVTCPDTGVTFSTSTGTVPARSQFECESCGRVQDVLRSVRAFGKTAPVSAYAFQGYSPSRDAARKPYGGRFFGVPDVRALIAAEREWEERKNGDLADFWPRTLVQPGLETTIRTPLLKYGYEAWADFFNARQLLAHSQILKAIKTLPGHRDETRELVLAVFQQYLRNNNMFCIWNIQRDTLEPFLSKNNFQPPTRPIENNVFGALGRGNWTSCAEGAVETLRWKEQPWDLAVKANLPEPLRSQLGETKSCQIVVGDNDESQPVLECSSSTDLETIGGATIDLVITDPPFGDIMQYGELSGFFYGWLRCALKDSYSCFHPEHPPVALEAVDNAARHGKDGPAFYQRLLTNCWREAHRILKPGGILAFTFHHDKDEPWVAVLESLFDAGFYLEAAFPVRADETKGEGGTPGTFGAQKVEYDIIHVCRKRTENPQPVSWGKLRREVMTDVRQLQAVLENHAKAGLPAADLQVIRRGKALEYFSRHYGRVYVDEGRAISVREALVGINQLIEEDADRSKETPPVNAEPITRQFLRTFGAAIELKRDQLQKFLRGTITTPDDFVQRGWCIEKNKVFTRVSPLEFARDWSGRHRRRLTSDLDQALVLVGACFDGSGIVAADTLKNENFRPHVALRPLLEWLQRNGPDASTRNAASRAVSIYNAWAASQIAKPTQGALFEEYEL